MTATQARTTDPETRTVLVNRVYIKTTPERVWQAIVDPEWNGRYGYAAPSVYELHAGGSYRSTASEEMRAYSAEHGYDVPDVVVDGEVLESDPPRKLVQTFRMLMDPATAAEGFSRLTWEISEISPGVSRLTVTHDVTGAPNLRALVTGAFEDQGAGGGGGWPWILSDLKSLLETGAILVG
jgi:uncharacterized protein YndB with AHSA1/START domain